MTKLKEASNFSLDGVALGGAGVLSLPAAGVLAFAVAGVLAFSVCLGVAAAGPLGAAGVFDGVLASGFFGEGVLPLTGDGSFAGDEARLGVLRGTNSKLFPRRSKPQESRDPI